MENTDNNQPTEVQAKIELNKGANISGSMDGNNCVYPTVYYMQVLLLLEVSFSPLVIRDDRMMALLRSSIPEMEKTIKTALSVYTIQLPRNEENIAKIQMQVRDYLILENVPFQHARKCIFRVQELPKDDERRLSLQALFLFVLRPFVPVKYENVAAFLKRYPDFVNGYTLNEQECLKNTANWMDLSFFTLHPKNNKTFLMNLIPRLCEGRNARYITGSGETRATADRVHIYRQEGNCEKVNRPPRKRIKSEYSVSHLVENDMLLPTVANFEFPRYTAISTDTSLLERQVSMHHNLEMIASRANPNTVISPTSSNSNPNPNPKPVERDHSMDTNNATGNKHPTTTMASNTSTPAIAKPSGGLHLLSNLAGILLSGDKEENTVTIGVPSGESVGQPVAAAASTGSGNTAPSSGMGASEETLASANGPNANRRYMNSVSNKQQRSESFNPGAAAMLGNKQKRSASVDMAMYNPYGMPPPQQQQRGGVPMHGGMMQMPRYSHPMQQPGYGYPMHPNAMMMHGMHNMPPPGYRAYPPGHSAHEMHYNNMMHMPSTPMYAVNDMNTSTSGNNSTSAASAASDRAADTKHRMNVPNRMGQVIGRDIPMQISQPYMQYDPYYGAPPHGYPVHPYASMLQHPHQQYAMQHYRIEQLKQMQQPPYYPSARISTDIPHANPNNTPASTNHPVTAANTQTVSTNSSNDSITNPRSDPSPHSPSHRTIPSSEHSAIEVKSEEINL